jgi:S1-C subfamily serine protease
MCGGEAAILTARRPRGTHRHYSSSFVDHGNRPERESGDDDYPVAPVPPHERVWRHPSELGGGQMTVPEPQPAFSKGVAAGAAVLSLLLVAGLTRIMVPTDGDPDFASSVTAAVQRASVPQFGTVSTPTSVPSGTDTTVDTGLASATSSLIATIGPDTTEQGSTPDDTASPATDPTDTAAGSTAEVPAVPTNVSTTPPPVSTVAPPSLALVMSPARSALAVEVQQGVVFVTTSAAVGDARSAPVVLDSGQTVQADVVLVDEDAGIAVLVVPSPEIPSAPDASMPPAVTAEPEPGEIVTVLRGTDAESRSEATLGDAVADNGGRELLDAAVGEEIGEEIGEGAPVIDADGNLVGLCTESGERTWVVPASALARAVDASLEMSRGSVWLGITGERAAAGGVSVLAVDDGSPAALSGLTVGDVVVGVEGRAVLSLAELAIDLGEHSPGDLVTITVERGVETIEFSVVLGERPPGT